MSVRSRQRPRRKSGSNAIQTTRPAPNTSRIRKSPSRAAMRCSSRRIDRAGAISGAPLGAARPERTKSWPGKIERQPASDQHRRRKLPDRHRLGGRQRRCREAEQRNQKCHWRDRRRRMARKEPAPARIAKERIGEGLVENGCPCHPVALCETVANRGPAFEGERQKKERWKRVKGRP